jgi:hypothetical protein
MGKRRAKRELTQEIKQWEVLNALSSKSSPAR